MRQKPRSAPRRIRTTPEACKACGIRRVASSAALPLSDACLHILPWTDASLANSARSSLDYRQKKSYVRQRESPPGRGGSVDGAMRRRNSAAWRGPECLLASHREEDGKRAHAEGVRPG